MGGMLLSEVASASREVAATSARLGKVEALAAALRAAGPDEAPVIVAYLSGELPQRQIGVGWATIKVTPPPSEHPSLTVAGVDAAFTVIGAVGGKGSAAERKRLVDELFGQATADEQHFLARLLSGELRQGALDGVMTDAVAKAAGVPGPEVRRAVMLSGSLAVTAAGGAGGGSEAPRARSGCRSDGRSSPCWPASEPSLARGPGADRRPGGDRVEAGRHPRPGAYQRGRGRGCSPAPSMTLPPRLPEVVDGPHGAAVPAAPSSTAS